MDNKTNAEKNMLFKNTMSKDPADVIVIGAGMAGLTLAKELMKKGQSILVLEGSNRIGGRAYTDIFYFGAPLDWGCSWLHSSDINPVTTLVKNMGLSIIDNNSREDMYYKGLKYSDEKVNSVHHSYEDLNKVIKNTIQDISLQEVISLIDNPMDDIVKKSLVLYTGVEQEDISVKCLAEEESTDRHSYVEGGLGNFVHVYGQNLPVKLNTMVNGIDYTKNIVEVFTNKGTFKGNKVVITVSVGVLQSNAIKFSPCLPKNKIDALKGYKMGLLNKIFIEVKPDSFRDLGLNKCVVGINEDDNIFLAVLNSHGSDICTYYVSGLLAHQLETLGEHAAIEYAVNSISRILGSNIKEHYAKAMTTQWGKNIFTRGSYSALLPGSYEAREILTFPIEEKIYFAGEAYSKDYPGQLAGAYKSALAIIDMI